MKAKSYDDLFDKYIRAKNICESIVLIKNGTGEIIFSKINMTKTYLPVSEKEYISMVYYGDKQLYRPQFIMYSKASGGCITTAKDLMIFIQAFFSGELFDKKMLDSKLYRKLQLSMFPIYYGSGYMRIKMGGFFTSFLGQCDLIGHSGASRFICILLS